MFDLPQRVFVFELPHLMLQDVHGSNEQGLDHHVDICCCECDVVPVRGLKVWFVTVVFARANLPRNHVGITIMRRRPKRQIEYIQQRSAHLHVLYSSILITMHFVVDVPISTLSHLAQMDCS
jgi:hypothetical protein